jgi:hypothetical protein
MLNKRVTKIMFENRSTFAQSSILYGFLNSVLIFFKKRLFKIYKETIFKTIRFLKYIK